MTTHDTHLTVRLPKADRDRFTKALKKRVQSKSQVLRAMIDQYCKDAERMGTTKLYKP